MSSITPEEFVHTAKKFIELSDKFFDSWSFHQNDNDILKTYVKKEEFVNHRDEGEKVFLYRAEYIIFYNLSYGVPSFSFNIWNSSGTLLTLEEVRQMSLMKISKEDFYSVITQQEHPVMHRPYFIIHPCNTEKILLYFKHTTKNLIVTFLGLITPLIQLNLPLEYGL
ncbi:unnamed protein product [Euphydryas editha]|uniref:Ubiquitin-like-conjugating enzyme ATG10 n=1 Tax=Euphydryas editha TaxID=104508 RepID=A0AAU9V7K2_EUPED|nr:unnamed protein product [Euphydryas editha]